MSGAKPSSIFASTAAPPLRAAAAPPATAPGAHAGEHERRPALRGLRATAAPFAGSGRAASTCPSPQAAMKGVAPASFLAAIAADTRRAKSRRMKAVREKKQRQRGPVF